MLHDEPFAIDMTNPKFMRETDRDIPHHPMQARLQDRIQFLLTEHADDVEPEKELAAGVIMFLEREGYLSR